ncbi:diguanylate cyclase [Kangiella japonica]|uniref:Diguanylate cyclase n=1 Tax=Kangiella japonica TaxID=647384 RepID=A0ABN0T3U9_9GAMM
MKSNWYIKNTFILLCILYVTICIYITEILVNAVTSEQSEEARSELLNEASLVRANIESSIYSDVYIANSLATVLTADQTLGVSRFGSIASTLKSKANYVRNIAVAKDYTIILVYPYAGNEKAKGFDYRTSPSQFQTVEQARVEQEVVLAGPLPLVQGGNGLIARYPIFTDYPSNEEYWGLVSVVFDVDELFKDSGLIELSERYDIAIKSSTIVNDDDGLFFGETSFFEQPDVEFSFDILAGTWRLAGKLKESSNAPLLTLPLVIRLVCYLTSLGLLISIILLFRAYRVATKISYRDELTGLANRRYAMEIIEKFINRRDHARFSLVSVDLNRFKYINDHHGHEAGDYVLQEISKTLVSCVRGSDFVFRLGGDEFLILLAGQYKTENLDKIIKKLKNSIDSRVFHFKGHDLEVSLSAGYARFPADSKDLDELLSISDVAMFEDKKGHQR